MKAVITMDVAEDVRAQLSACVVEDVTLVFAGGPSEEDVVAACRGAEVVVGPEHLEAILSTCPSVRLVQVPWAGVRHVCKTLRNHDGVRLANSHANAYVTAQYAVALALGLVNRLVAGHMLMADGRWAERYAGSSPVNLSDKTIGILGAGHIGRAVAHLVAPFAARVIGLRRNPSDEPPPPFERIVGALGLHALLHEADVVFVTLPLTAATRGLLGAEELDRLGPSGYLINVGRGPIVDEPALYRALTERRIAGAAVEVWYDYNPEPDVQGRRYPYQEPFHTLDNVLLSPHWAGWTDPSPDYWTGIADNINRLAAGRDDLVNEVDVEEGY